MVVMVMSNENGPNVLKSNPRFCKSVDDTIASINYIVFPIHREQVRRLRPCRAGKWTC